MGTGCDGRPPHPALADVRARLFGAHGCALVRDDLGNLSILRVDQEDIVVLKLGELVVLRRRNLTCHIAGQPVQRQ